VNERAPTQDELMRHADGELEPERAAEVEAYLVLDDHARAVVATIHEIGDHVRDVAEQRVGDAADGVADAVMARIEQQAALSPEAGKVVALPGGPRQPAPEAASSSVWPVAVGALAVAAAVALVVWRVAGIDLVEPPATEPRVAEAPSVSPEMVVASAPAPAPDYDPEPTVSVDAVDFGARTGTIFYVPSDTGTTTVVWLSDDEGN